MFGEFTAATGLADAFGGACPPTFRAEYLPAGATTHCIDFILTAGEVTAESAALVFAEKERLGYVSDHIGLRARLSLPPHTRGRTEPLARREVEMPWKMVRPQVDEMRIVSLCASASGGSPAIRAPTRSSNAA